MEMSIFTFHDRSSNESQDLTLPYEHFAEFCSLHSLIWFQLIYEFGGLQNLYEFLARKRVHTMTNLDKPNSFNSKLSEQS